MLQPFPRAPIVLVHGLLGFAEVNLGRLRVKCYFPGIYEYLRVAGYRVHMPQLSLTRGIAHRAQELKQFIEENFPEERVHIFAHSMGGLDARYMLSRLDMAPRVLSLTTIGTPHRGTAFADWGIRRLSRILRPFLDYAKISSDAFFDLTTENCLRLNEQMPDAEGVRYFSIAGRCEAPLLGAEWRLPWRIVNEIEGPNDGIVSVSSASYGEVCEIWEADHLNLVNWPNRKAQAKGCWRDRSNDYRRLADHVSSLRAVG